jgi:hypothetical protein
MEIALIKTKPRTKPSHQYSIAANSNKKTEEPNPQKTEKIKTHLTIIGVCTTIRPEKSGT